MSRRGSDDRRTKRPGVNFASLNEVALQHLPMLLGRWLPGGRWQGREYIVANPCRADETPGSFKINRNGRWADFATGDKGGDLISLAAYLFGLRQIEAARRLANMLGVK